MPRDAADTRAALLEAGRRLFASEGIYSVPLANIIKAAGQHNSSALHYHFASEGVDARTGLLFAIIATEDDSVEVKRQEMMDAVKRDGRLDDLPALVRTAIIPLAHKFEEVAGREYLAIISQMVDHFNSWDARGPRMPGVAFETFVAIEKAIPQDLDPLIRRDRVVRFLQMAVETLGSHARYLNSLTVQPADPKRLDTQSLLDNLIDMSVGALTAPQLNVSSAPNRAQQ